MSKLERAHKITEQSTAKGQCDSNCSVDEESVEREYRARIESLLERASRLLSDVTGNVLPDGEAAAGRVEGRASSDADEKPQSCPPRQLVTSEQIRALRDVANSSAREAVTTHTQGLRRRARALLWCALLVALASTVMFQLPLDVGFAKHLVALPLCIVALVLSVEYFRTARRLKRAPLSGKSSRGDGLEEPRPSDAPPTASSD